MVDVLFIVLLVLHVGSIVAWMGGGALFLSVISPSLSKMSPSSRSEFVRLTLPRYFRFITGSSIIDCSRADLIRLHNPSRILPCSEQLGPCLSSNRLRTRGDSANFRAWCRNACRPKTGRADKPSDQS